LKGARVSFYKSAGKKKNCVRKKKSKPKKGEMWGRRGSCQGKISRKAAGANLTVKRRKLVRRERNPVEGENRNSKQNYR